MPPIILLLGHFISADNHEYADRILELDILPELVNLLFSKGLTKDILWILTNLLLHSEFGYREVCSSDKLRTKLVSIIKGGSQ